MSQDLSAPPVHPVFAALGVVQAGVADVSQVSLWSMSDADIGEALAEIETVTAQLAAGRLALVAEADARNLGVADATSTAGWLRGRLLMGPGEAKSAVRLARELRDECVETGTAMGRGLLSAEHARVITQAVTHLPPVDPDTKAKAEAFLIGQATVLDPLLLRRAAEALHETLTTQPDRDERILRDVARREFTAVPAADGMMKLCGWMDREGWAEIAAVLDPLSAPAPAADGTLDLRPVMNVTIDLESLSGQLTRMGRLNTGEPITAAAARRIGCDAELIPVVLGTAEQPLDVGRSTRIVPAPMRRALICRDEACAFPGCDRLAAWADAHHIVHWADGGDTALDNLVLLCSDHHHAVHHHGWTVFLESDGLPTFRPPPWIDPQQTPRRHHRYQLRQLDYDLNGPDPPDQ